MATRSGVRIIIQIEGVSLSSGAGINGATVDLARRYELAWAQGTSAGQVDKVFQDELSVGTSPTDLDLAGGSNVKDPASQADQTFTRLHAVVIKNTHASQTLTIGGDANSAPLFDDDSDEITLASGEVFVWSAKTGTDGITVTAGTGDILQLTGSGAATTCEVTLIGR